MVSWFRSCGVNTNYPDLGLDRRDSQKLSCSALSASFKATRHTSCCDQSQHNGRVLAQMRKSSRICAEDPKQSFNNFTPVAKSSQADPARKAEEGHEQHLSNADLRLDSSNATAADSISLLCVSLLWSTYSPALRYLFSLPGPPTPAALTTVRAVMQASCLLPVTLLQGGAWAKTDSSVDGSRDDGVTNSNADSNLGTQAQFLRAAAELGLLNFGGTALQGCSRQQQPGALS